MHICKPAVHQNLKIACGYSGRAHRVAATSSPGLAAMASDCDSLRKTLVRYTQDTNANLMRLNIEKLRGNGEERTRIREGDVNYDYSSGVYFTLKCSSGGKVRCMREPIGLYK